MSLKIKKFAKTEKPLDIKLLRLMPRIKRTKIMCCEWPWQKHHKSKWNGAIRSPIYSFDTLQLNDSV